MEAALAAARITTLADAVIYLPTAPGPGDVAPTVSAGGGVSVGSAEHASTLEAVARRVVTGGQPLVIDGARAAASAGLPAAAGSILALPVFLGREAGGVLIVTAARDAAFPPAAVDALSAIAAQLGASLTLARETALLWQLAHDLTTPLSSVLGFMDLIDERAARRLPAQSREFLKLATCAAEQAVYIVAEMRDVMYLAGNRLTLRVAPLDAASLVGKVVASIAPLANEARVQVRLREVGQLPTIVADERRLERILNNLLQNAIKFSRGDGVVWVGVGLASEDTLRITVEDEGPGFDDADLSRLFASGQQGTIAPPRGDQGLGLGLSTSLALAQAHGGDLRAENRAEGGARFILDLPLAPAQHPNVAEPPAPRVRRSHQSPNPTPARSTTQMRRRAAV